MRFKLLRRGTGATFACSTRKRANCFANICRTRAAHIESQPKTATQKHR